MRERSAIRAVVDTNVFVSGTLSSRGRPGRLLDLWYEGRFELLLSGEQHAELTNVFSRPRIVRDERITRHVLARLLTALALATRVIPSPRVPLSVRDPKDEPILAAALGGNADYLVTGDGDLLALQGDPLLGSTEIVTVAQFFAILDEQAGAES
jgi:putative PIN family toxin of toxin-antitoxin system